MQNLTKENLDNYYKKFLAKNQNNDENQKNDKNQNNEENLNINSILTLNEQSENDLLRRIKLNEFFNLINIIKATNPTGETIGLKLPIASTTDTDKKDREPNASYLQPTKQYHCKQINVDGYIPYSKLDALAGTIDKDFALIYEELLDTEIISSLLLAGFNGRKRAETSDPTNNPLAQDAAEGWLGKIANHAKAQVITGATVGADRQYKSINALIKAGLEKIPNPIKARGDLIAICGRDVLLDSNIEIKYSDLTQNQAEKITVLNQLLGGLRAVNIPYFPANSILITRFDNISFYLQRGTVRTFKTENPSLDRLELYNSMCVDFIIEDYQSCALIENINIEE